MWITLLSITVLACFVNALDDGCIVCGGACPAVVANPRLVEVNRRGYISSPGYAEGKGYPDNVKCAYTLRVPKGMHIRLKFLDINITISDFCLADNVVLHDFDPQNQTVLRGLYCGRARPNDFVSQSSQMQIAFKSDDFATARGFNLSYTLQDTPDLCHHTQIECMNRKCVSNSKVCDGIDDCGDGTDEENCSVPDLVVKECGRREVDHGVSGSDRIVGGEPAPENSWPWMADIQMGAVLPNGHYCGGSLINAQWVVTAAHCFKEPIMRKPEGLRIHLGNQRKYENDTFEQVRYAERIVVYDDIPPSKFEAEGNFDLVHDIALVKLNAPVQFSRGVKPVCLPDEDLESDIFNPHIVCYSTGWGATRGSGYNDELKQSYYPIHDGKACQKYEWTRELFNNQTMVCAGSLYPMNGACHGDSGGPLVCEINKEWHLFGVTSYLTDLNLQQGMCGLQDRPTVFCKVAVKTKWIRRMVQKYSYM